MANKTKFQAIKGTRDLLPPDTELWNRVEQTAREVFGTFGFGEIRPPIFEPTELFARAVGGETDIVSKEMYTFEDRPGELPDFKRGSYNFVQAVADVTKLFETEQIPHSGLNEVLVKFLGAKVKKYEALNEKLQAPNLSSESTQEILEEFKKIVGDIVSDLNTLELGPRLSLRPEATASVCRAYVERNMHALPQPVKLYYIGPMFRREKPQKGRYRQFHQIGAEVLKTVQPGQGGAKDIPKDAAVDAEVIEMLMEFFVRLDLNGLRLEINSIGHNAPDCRPAYISTLRTSLENLKVRLCKDSQRRIETNPLRVLDSKVSSEQDVISSLPRISDYLCDDCKKHFDELKRQLDLREVKYTENWRLVRGLDYYMRTTFEITATGLGSQNAVCGGGRYDGLVELIGGPPTKGIGFAIGEDRLIMSLEDQQRYEKSGPRADLMVTASGEPTWNEALRLASRLRKQGLAVFIPSPGTKLNKALEHANRQRIRLAIIVGESERASGKYVVRILQPFEEESTRDQQIPIGRIDRYGKLVKLRNDLERKIKGLLGPDPKGFKGETIRRMVQRLEIAGFIPPKVVHEFSDLVPLL